MDATRNRMDSTTTRRQSLEGTSHSESLKPLRPEGSFALELSSTAQKLSPIAAPLVEHKLTEESDTPIPNKVEVLTKDGTTLYLTNIVNQNTYTLEFISDSQCLTCTGRLDNIKAFIQSTSCSNKEEIQHLLTDDDALSSAITLLHKYNTASYNIKRFEFRRSVSPGSGTDDGTRAISNEVSPTSITEEIEQAGSFRLNLPILNVIPAVESPQAATLENAGAQTPLMGPILGVEASPTDIDTPPPHRLQELTLKTCLEPRPSHLQDLRIK